MPDARVFAVFRARLEWRLRGLGIQSLLTLATLSGSGYAASGGKSAALVDVEEDGDSQWIEMAARHMREFHRQPCHIA